MPDHDRDDLSKLSKEASKRFWRAGFDCFYDFQRGTSATWYGPDQKYYRDEKRIVVNHFTPLATGLYTTLFLFATFRITGSKIFRRFKDHVILNKPPPTINPVEEPSQWKSYLTKLAEQRKESVPPLLFLARDLVVSVMCGLSIAAFFSDWKEMMRQLPDVPLLPGKSHVHSTMCPSFVEVYNSTDPRVFQTATDNIIQSFERFSKNCDSRSRVIAQRKRDPALVGTPDVIPYPGIKGFTRDGS